MDKMISINPSSNMEVEASSQSDAAPVSRHPRFYTTDGVTFLIENQLYRIPEHILCSSEFFRDMLQSPALGDHKALEGRVDDKPITPADVTTIEMESLLELLLAQALDGFPTLDFAHLSAALHLSTKWGFDKAREYAIKAIYRVLILGQCLPLDLLELGFKSSVPKWVVPAYESLCSRVEDLTLEEAKRLGIQKYFAISRIRQHRASQMIPRCTCGRQVNTPKFACSRCGDPCIVRRGVGVELRSYCEVLGLDKEIHLQTSPEVWF